MSKNTFNQPPTSILSTESYQSDYFPSNRSRKKAIELRVRSILFTFLALVFLNLIVEQPIRSLNLLLRLKPESDKSHLRDPSNWSIHQSQGNDSLTKVQRLEYELITSNRSSSSSSSSSELKESLLLTTNKKLLNLNDNRWNLLMIHGLGDLGATQAHQISSSLRRSDPELFSKFNFIIPHAGLIRISVFEKDIRPGWFDIRSWDNINEDEDLDGFYSSVRSLQLMMTELGLDLNRTIVAGFSQGAVMSLLLTLTLKRPPLLTIMMSGYFPIQETIKELILQGKRNSTYRSEEFVRLYWLHGRLDPYFKIKTIRENFKRLKNYLKLRFLIDNQSSIRDVTNRTDSLDVRLLAENQSSSRPQKNLNDWNISRVSIVEFKEFEGLDHNWNDQEIQFILQTFKKLPIY